MTKLEIEYEGVEAYVVLCGKRIASYLPNFRKSTPLVLTILNNDVAFELNTLRYHSQSEALKALQAAVERITTRTYANNGEASMNGALLDSSW
jgi:hypothetical protein